MSVPVCSTAPVGVAATAEADVRAALTAAGVEAQTTEVPSTLDEVMVASLY